MILVDIGGRSMNKKYDNLDEYKMAVLSDCIKSTDIMKKITLPQSVLIPRMT